MRSIGPAVTREQSPAFLRNSNGRLDLPGPNFHLRHGGGKTCLFPKIGLPGHNSQAKGINKRGHKLLTKEERVERLGMKKHLMAGKLVQINETMRALTFLMDVSG